MYLNTSLKLVELESILILVTVEYERNKTS